MTREPSEIYDLSDDQLDGLACVECGKRGGPMVPLPQEGPRGQLFRHVDCDHEQNAQERKVP